MSTPIIQMPPRELAEYVSQLAEAANPTIYAVPLLACADKLRDQADRIAALEAALRPFAEDEGYSGGRWRMAREALGLPLRPGDRVGSRS